MSVFSGLVEAFLGGRGMSRTRNYFINPVHKPLSPTLILALPPQI